MKPIYLLIMLSLTALVGCGDSSRGRGALETQTPRVTEEDFVVPSQIHRTSGLPLLTSKQEADEILATSLPSGYRTIPLMALDDEGLAGKNISTRSSLGRPAADCGLVNGSSIPTRIANCSEVNGSTSLWDATNGAAGESSWRLVTKSGAQEIWLDLRTGHLWSDVLDSTNWCNASGNQKKEDGAAVNCETVGINLTCAGKTLMGLTGVKWRLPTRNDFLQADLDGLRFVLKVAGTTGFWTATMNSKSNSRNEAWVYIQEQGTLESAVLTENRQVRCLGAASL